MIKGILGKKLGMTQVFAIDGRRIPVTVVEAGPCVVLQKKTEATDGYNALQLGFGDEERPTGSTSRRWDISRRPAKGPFDHLRELRVDSVDEYNVGDEISLRRASLPPGTSLT